MTRNERIAELVEAGHTEGQARFITQPLREKLQHGLYTLDGQGVDLDELRELLAE